VNEQGMNK